MADRSAVFSVVAGSAAVLAFSWYGVSEADRRSWATDAAAEAASATSAAVAEANVYNYVAAEPTADSATRASVEPRVVTVTLPASALAPAPSIDLAPAAPVQLAPARSIELGSFGEGVVEQRQAIVSPPPVLTTTSPAAAPAPVPAPVIAAQAPAPQPVVAVVPAPAPQPAPASAPVRKSRGS